MTPAEIGKERKCPQFGDYAFQKLWSRVQKAICGIYDHTTFQGLIDEDATLKEGFVPSYVI